MIARKQTQQNSRSAYSIDVDRYGWDSERSRATTLETLMKEEKFFAKGAMSLNDSMTVSALRRDAVLKKTKRICLCKARTQGLTVITLELKG